MTAVDVNHNLTAEQAQLREQAHRFATEVMRPIAKELALLSPEEVIAPQSRLWEAFRQSYKAGYHLRGFPPELGGAGLGPLDAWVVSAAFGWGNAGLSISLGVTSMPFRFAAMTGNPDLKQGARAPRAGGRE